MGGVGFEADEIVDATTEAIVFGYDKLGRAVVTGAAQIASLWWSEMATRLKLRDGGQRLYARAAFHIRADTWGSDFWCAKMGEA